VISLHFSSTLNLRQASSLAPYRASWARRGTRALGGHRLLFRSKIS
jgi:hypothetical protein